MRLAENFTLAGYRQDKHGYLVTVFTRRFGDLRNTPGAADHRYFMDAAVEQMRGRRVEQLQLVGFGRLDRLEWLELVAFVEACQVLRVLPPVCQLWTLPYRTEWHDEGTESVPHYVPQGQRLTDHCSVRIVQSPNKPSHGENFTLLMADLVTANGLQLFLDQLHRFERV